MWLMMMTAFGGNYEILQGERPTRELQAAVNTRQKTLARCFASSQGPAKFHITVGADGYVSDAKYSMDGDTNPEMLQCIYSEALKLRLLPSKLPGSTTYLWMASPTSIAEPPEDDGMPKELGVKGVHSLEQVKEILELNASSFDFCKRKAKTKDIAVPDSITLFFNIDTTSHATAATVANLEPDVFTECVVSRVNGLTFPPPSKPGSSKVAYPLVFTK